MKNLVILVILVGLGYYGYNAFNNSDTVNQATVQSQVADQEGLEDLAGDIPSGTQGALVDINNQIKDTLDAAKDAVEKTQDRFNEAIEEGVTDLADTDIEGEAREEIVAGPGSYLDYADVDLASLEGKIVLDFYASWCPSCRKLESDIKGSLADIPSDVTIVKVDYDAETALKQKYGVTKQHTMVQVDNQGNLIQKWSGGSTLESIVNKLK